MPAGCNFNVKERTRQGSSRACGKSQQRYLCSKRRRKPTRSAQADSATAYTAALARCVVARSSPTINAGFTVHMV